MMNKIKRVPRKRKNKNLLVQLGMYSTAPLIYFHEGLHYLPAWIFGLKPKIHIRWGRSASTSSEYGYPWQAAIVAATPLVGTVVVILLIYQAFLNWSGAFNLGDWITFLLLAFSMLATCWKDVLDLIAMARGKY